MAYSSASVWYYDPENGSSGNGGTAPDDAKAKLSEAVALANADGGAGQVIYAMSGPNRVPCTETAAVTVTVEDLQVVGYDSAGHVATDLEAFAWDERPLLVFDHFGQGVIGSHASSLTFYGFEWDGNSKSANGYSQGVAGARVLLYDHLGHDFVGSVVSSGSGGMWAERFEWWDSAHGLSTIGAGGPAFLRCGVIRAMSGEGVNKAASTDFVGVDQVLVTDCGGTNGPLAYAHDGAYSSYWIIRNSVIYDNPTPYGLAAGVATFLANTVYSSDTASYHTTSNWNGTRNADDYELPPVFVDYDGGDFHLQASSPLVGLAESQLPEYTQDRLELPNVLGPLGPGGLVAVVRGSHLVLVQGYTPDLLQQPSQWTIAGGQDHLLPMVALVERYDTNALLLHTDRPLQQGVTYTITAATGDTCQVVGPRVEIGTEATLALEALADYVAPFTPDGGGHFILGDGGDFMIRGGLPALMGILWHKVLTRLGELYYAPQSGVDLRPKGLVPPDLAVEQRRLQQAIEAHPYVNAAQVMLRAEDDTLAVTIRVDTDLGSTTETRTL